MPKRKSQTVRQPTGIADGLHVASLNHILNNKSMGNKTFERLAVMLMMAILMCLLFCAYLLVQLSNKQYKNGTVAQSTQTDDGASKLKNKWTLVIDTAARSTTLKSKK